MTQELGRTALPVDAVKSELLALSEEYESKRAAETNPNM